MAGSTPRKKKATAEFKAIRAAAKPAERSVPICFRADLRARMQELQRELKAAQDERVVLDSLDGGSRSVELAEQVEAARADMVGATVEFRLRRLPRERMRELELAHPNEAGGLGMVNPDTYYPALIRACTYEPALDDDDWEWLFGPDQLSAAEYGALVDAAVGVNVRDVEVPFSRTASRILADYERESKRRSDSDTL